MDITPIFKAKLESIGNRHKALADGPTVQPRRILPTKKSEYYSKAKEVVLTLNSLRSYLLENRAAYLDVSETAKFHPNANTMTELERDQMDLDVQKVVHNCQARVQALQLLTESSGAGAGSQAQLKIHMENIVNSIRNYIKEISSFYSEMKAIRVRRTLSIQTVSKLYPSPSTSSSAPRNTTVTDRFGKVEEKRPDKTDNFYRDINAGAAAGSLTAFLDDDDEPLSAEEIQMLEQENHELLNRLNTLSDEVDQIQSNVVSIAQLQSIFTEKVLEQDKDIENVANSIVNASENVKMGNEQIRQAIQQNADFRAWVLFFIIVMSLSLLFLDWYND